MERTAKPVEGQFNGQGAEAIYGDLSQRFESTLSSLSCGPKIAAHHPGTTQLIVYLLEEWKS